MGLGQRALHGLLEVLPGSLVLCVHGVYGAGSHRLGFSEGWKEGVLGRLRREGSDSGSRGLSCLEPGGRVWSAGPTEGPPGASRPLCCCTVGLGLPPMDATAADNCGAVPSGFMSDGDWLVCPK